MRAKMGNTFPCRDIADSNGIYAGLIAEALRAELGESHRALKTIMRWTGASERTAKNWYTGTIGPSGANLIELVRHSDEVYEAFCEQAGRQEAVSTAKLMDSRDAISQFLDYLNGLLPASKSL